jgi:radical SAM superfamily enzyme YgiQ (UPF0313 family)
MRVLFIYSNHVKDLLPAPPIGLSYVASATESAGHEVRFVDLLLAKNGLDELKLSLGTFQPDIVAISVRNIDNVIHQRLLTHLDVLKQQIVMIRKMTKAQIVLGGPAISILGHITLDHLDADFAILGEGEESFPLLLSAIEKHHDLKTIPGLCFRDKSKNVAGVPQRQPSFGASGMERWISWTRYEKCGATWPIQTKRGCPFSCTYCTYPTIEGKKFRKRDPEDIVEEIRVVSKTQKPRCFEFIDSVFNIPEAHSIALCEAIIRADLNVNFTTMGVNPYKLSKELLTLMKRAGFNSIMVTPESASDPILESMRKGFTVEAVHKCAQLVKESGIPSMWFFMLGSLGETKETAEETISFVEKHLNWRNCLPMFTTGIRILPGTELASQARNVGYLSQYQDLVESTFYFSPDVSEQWMLDRVNRAVAICPNIVHAAEDPSSSALTQYAFKAMHLLGIAPPYWRFFSGMLSLNLVHAGRKRQKQRQLMPKVG